MCVCVRLCLRPVSARVSTQAVVQNKADEERRRLLQWQCIEVILWTCLANFHSRAGQTLQVRCFCAQLLNCRRRDGVQDVEGFACINLIYNICTRDPDCSQPAKPMATFPDHQTRRVQAGAKREQNKEHQNELMLRTSVRPPG